jgi:hypothetical protein
VVEQGEDASGATEHGVDLGPVGQLLLSLLKCLFEGRVSDFVVAVGDPVLVSLILIAETAGP